MAARAVVARVIQRGDIRWYQFGRPDKRRPVLILTRDSALEYLSGVTIAPVTSTIRGVPSEVALSREDGMPRPCAINLHGMQTVPMERVGAFITSLTPDTMELTRKSLLFALGFDD